MTKHLKANMNRLVDADHGDVWREGAACLNQDPEIFFVDGDAWEAPRNRSQLEAAKAFCEWCPVRLDCLNDALRPKRLDHNGIRGGMTPAERKQEARRRRDAALREARAAARAKVAG